MRLPILQQKILSALLVVTIVAPFGLFTQPKKVEASCSFGGGGGGSSGGTYEGVIQPPGSVELPIPARFSIKLLPEATPIAVSAPSEIFKSAGDTTVFKKDFDTRALDNGAHVATGDATSALQAVQIGIETAMKAIGCITSIASSLTSQLTNSLVAKEFLLDGIAYALVNQIIADMLNDIQKWAVTGFKGSPVFLTNPEKYFRGLADEALGAFLNEVAGVNLCNLKWRALISIALDIDLGYHQRAQCTFSGIGANFDQFMNDFSQGGWGAWIELTTKQQNNPYGSYLLAANEAAKRIGQVPQGILGKKLLELQWGKGMISITRCKVGEITADDLNDEKGIYSYDLGKCKDSGGMIDPFETEIVSPGSIIENAINNTLNTTNERIVAADEINETLIAVMYGLLVKTFSSEKGFAGANWSNLSSQVGQVPVQTKEALLDFINKFVASEAKYKAQKELSLYMANGAKGFLDGIAACYASQITLNEQYQKGVSSGQIPITLPTMNNPFASFSSAAVATSRQSILDFVAQHIAPRIKHFQGNVDSSTQFSAEMTSMLAEVNAVTTSSGLNVLSESFAKKNSNWHNEIAAADAENEFADTKKFINDNVATTARNTEMAECSATRQKMRDFLIQFDITPALAPGTIRFRATLNGSLVTKTNPIAVDITSPDGKKTLNFQTNTQADYINSNPAGEYTVTLSAGNTLGAGTVLKNITPSSVQPLIEGGDITFTFNFTSK